jgi:hypothetical protein
MKKGNEQAGYSRQQARGLKWNRPQLRVIRIADTETGKLTSGADAATKS